MGEAVRVVLEEWLFSREQGGTGRDELALGVGGRVEAGQGAGVRRYGRAAELAPSTARPPINPYSEEAWPGFATPVPLKSCPSAPCPLAIAL